MTDNRIGAKNQHFPQVKDNSVCPRVLTERFWNKGLEQDLLVKPHNVYLGEQILTT